MKIAFLALSIFLSQNALAWVPSAPHKVKIQFKNGTVKTGYVIGDSNSESKFDASAFLKNFLGKENKYRKFELYGKIYSINDNGKMGGIAFANNEKDEVLADEVKRIVLLKSAHENDERNGVLVLPKKVIDIMKMKLISSEDSRLKGGSWQYFVFNYDPGISKDKIHKLLLKYINDISGKETPSSHNEKLGPGNILFFAEYSD